MRRYRDPLVVLILLVLPFVFYVSNSKATRDHNAFDRAVVLVSAPVQWMVTGVLDGVGSLWRRYIALVNVQQDNERLRADNERLHAELAAREEDRYENARLRLLAGLRERSPEVSMIYAQVVATSPSPLFRSIRVDQGAAQGVEVGSAVAGRSGVVGRVAAVAEHYSDVMLLVDANSSTDVLVQRTRARARVRGLGGDRRLGLTLEYLSRTADVEPGDVLITSGLGTVFPKGLRVGRVTAVERRAFGLYQHATVAPAVDFGRIEEVMIIQRGWPRQATFETGTPTRAGDSAPRARAAEPRPRSANLGEAVADAARLSPPPRAASSAPVQAGD